MKRSRLTRKTPLERSAKSALRGSAPKRSGSAAQSPRATSKRSKGAGVPQDVYEAVWHRDGGRCQAHRMGFALDLPCSGRPHAHHRVLRSQGGPHTVDNLVLICDRMHTLAHRHVGWARCCGVIIPSYADPGDVAQNDIRLRDAIYCNEIPPIGPWVTDSDLASASLHDERWVRAAALAGRSL